MPPPEMFGGSMATSVSEACSAMQLRLGQQRIAVAEADLRQARAGAHDDREGARADFEIERAVVAGRDLVELLAVVGHDAGEDVEPAGRALRIGRGRDVGRQGEAFEQRHDIDAAGLQHRAVGEVDLVQLEPVELVGDQVIAGPGRKLARTRKALAPSRRSRLAGWIWSASSGASPTSAPPMRTAPRYRRSLPECRIVYSLQPVASRLPALHSIP